MKEKSIPDVIAELREMCVADLVDQYEAVFGRPPRVKHRDWLWRRIAWKVQEQRFGGLSSTAKSRLDELIAELDLPLDGSRPARTALLAAKPGDPPLGTTLIRVWRGQEVHVKSVEGGWEHDGVVHRSLTAVARAVTGSRWNGRLFFGLTQKRKAEG